MFVQEPDVTSNRSAKSDQLWKEIRSLRNDTIATKTSLDNIRQEVKQLGQLTRRSEQRLDRIISYLERDQPNISGRFSDREEQDNSKLCRSSEPIARLPIQQYPPGSSLQKSEDILESEECSKNVLHQRSALSCESSDYPLKPLVSVIPGKGQVRCCEILHM